MVLDLDTARSLGHHRFMTLAEALQLAEDEYCDSPEPETLIEAEHKAIVESSPFDFIVGTNAETIPEVGVLSALHCAVVMGIRFGMRTQRILQRAATPGPRPGMPARSSTPVPGQPIYRGPIRPGQPVMRGRAKRKTPQYDS